MDMRCTSSQELVLHAEDLLTLILLRLPYKKLMSFKSVSKKWHSLITTPFFTRLLRNIFPPRRASALFIQRTIPVFFVPLDNRNATSPFRTEKFNHDGGQTRMLQSCNGLILCITGLPLIFDSRSCHVYNPSTGHRVTLPKEPLRYGRGGSYIGLTYDPLKSPHYKVIAFVVTSELNIFVGDLHIYSSETRAWKASIKSFIPPQGLISFENGVCWKGCMHWYSSNLPDSCDSDCLYFNVDEERFGTFPRPPIGAKRTSKRIMYFGESEDHLHVIEGYATSLSVYEMKNDYSGWFVRYQIDLDPISEVFPKMPTLFKDYTVFVLSLIRREKFQEDSFLVLEIRSKVIFHNLVDRSFKLIQDLPVTLKRKETGRRTLGEFQVCPYFESVSYA
ncbi:putative F-box family protein [Heracleum sosnowskyi]|uniref:F-box family protein n=1 Tax=Heracleum sosnowskyi TaxID=360622 RepID=A0AAD8LVX8_9APIA|nr:putative F-box family protein [Heracleum sosnowskyi]